MTKEEKDKIFEPFYTKKIKERNGTGLGMSVVWGTVQDHKGIINIVSKKKRRNNNYSRPPCNFGKNTRTSREHPYFRTYGE